MAADGVQAVVRAFSVLRAIAANDGAAGVTAVARHARLPKSTAARLLATLEDIGAVERLGGDAAYRIGPGLRALCGSGAADSRLVDVAHPYLRELVDDIDEDAALAVPAGTDILFVDQVQSSHPVQVQDWTGERFPLHTTAAGSVILAEFDDGRLTEYLRTELARFTPQTLVDPDAIRKRLEAVRDAGYAWTVDEWAEGITGVGAPIRAPDGHALGAINLYGPSYRFPAERDAAAIGRRTRETAERIGALLSA
jgi:DNA-binding IclR family transcriptional regulator